MRLLLDTHVALWWLNDPSRLTEEGRTALADTRNETYLSAASIWEVALKEVAGRLETPSPTEDAAREAGILELPIRWSHARRAASLPALHRDPFDRMLVAQALEEHMVLVTRDPLVHQYRLPTLPS